MIFFSLLSTDQGPSAIPAKKNNEFPNGAKFYSLGEGSLAREDVPLGKTELAGIAESPLELLELIGNELVLEVYWGEPVYCSWTSGSVALNCIDMDYFEGTFNVVISINALEWVQNSYHICQALLSSLRINGKCLIVSMSPDSDYLCILKKALKDPRLGWEGASLISDSALSIRDYQMIAKENHCRIIHSEIKREMIVFHSLDEMQDEAMKTAVKFLPEHLHTAFLEIFAEYAETYNTEDGLILIPSRTLILLLVD